MPLKRRKEQRREHNAYRYHYRFTYREFGDAGELWPESRYPGTSNYTSIWRMPSKRRKDQRREHTAYRCHFALNIGPQRQLWESLSVRSLRKTSSFTLVTLHVALLADDGALLFSRATRRKRRRKKKKRRKRRPKKGSARSTARCSVVPSVSRGETAL